MTASALDEGGGEFATIQSAGTFNLTKRLLKIALIRA